MSEVEEGECHGRRASPSASEQVKSGYGSKRTLQAYILVEHGFEISP